MTDPAPNFCALCAELGALMIDLASTHPNLSENGVRIVNELSDRADAALATPAPEPPTVMEILELSGEIEDAGLGQIDLVRAAIKRWGHR